jgi:cathepsin A (carboxypeptidase C)
LFDPFFSTSVNPYDIRKRCIHNDRFDSCYKEIEDIETYANRQDVKTEFGVDSEAGSFSNCNKHVKTRFELNEDRYGFTT